jgi:hypothetical protein
VNLFVGAEYLTGKAEYSNEDSMKAAIRSRECEEA